MAGGRSTLSEYKYLEETSASLPAYLLLADRRQGSEDSIAALFMMRRAASICLYRWHQWHRKFWAGPSQTGVNSFRVKEEDKFGRDADNSLDVDGKEPEENSFVPSPTFLFPIGSCLLNR